jgi:tetratricopeptide (TPR) repeat protein
MRAASRKFPDDLDVAALTAEALMNLHPWDYWGAAGDAKEGTAEILRLLELVLAKNPNHPGANHYYVHAVEASTAPERGLAAADRLQTLMPGAAHMVHMPSHLYARVGRYADAAEANRKAIKVDDAYLAQRKDQGFYMMYVAHNHQFLWWTALMQGRSVEALAEARAVQAMAPPEMLKDMPGFDLVLGYSIWTLLQTGKYDLVLAEPAPPEGFPWLAGTTHAARAIALSRLGRTQEADAEIRAMTALSGQIPADAVEGLNPAQLTFSIATALAQGELARAQGNARQAETLLRSAVALEATLRYDEPPDWYTPASGNLGDFLLAAGRAAEAQQVFEADLARYPENGWGLAGLTQALRAQKKTQEATAAEARLAKAWAQADLPKPAAR